MDECLIKQFDKDVLASMDSSYEELLKKLQPVLNDKTKVVNGKLLKDCFKHIKNIIRCHNHIRNKL